MTDVQQWIKQCEGLDLKLKKDTVHKWTIGYGRNIEDNGISIDEAELMFKNDLKRTINELDQYNWFINQPQSIKDALINMNFNMGIHRLLGFKKMIASLDDHNYAHAALEALNSKWAKQVPNRAKDIAVMIRQSEWH